MVDNRGGGVCVPEPCATRAQSGRFRVAIAGGAKKKRKDTSAWPRAVRGNGAPAHRPRPLDRLRALRGGGPPKTAQGAAIDPTALLLGCAEATAHDRGSIPAPQIELHRRRTPERRKAPLPQTSLRREEPERTRRTAWAKLRGLGSTKYSTREKKE
ncbi:hypothetical protein MRX96_024562 [Rhipicephalus microplus]